MGDLERTTALGLVSNLLPFSFCGPLTPAVLPSALNTCGSSQGAPGGGADPCLNILLISFCKECPVTLTVSKDPVFRHQGHGVPACGVRENQGGLRKRGRVHLASEKEGQASVSET